MDEWFKSHAWKACIGESLSGVRIPLSPPEYKAPKAPPVKESPILVRVSGLLLFRVCQFSMSIRVSEYVDGRHAITPKWAPPGGLGLSLRIGIPDKVRHLWPRLKNGNLATNAFRASLKTSDRAEAITLAHKLIAEYRTKFQAQVTSPSAEGIAASTQQSAHITANLHADCRRMSCRTDSDRGSCQVLRVFSGPPRLPRPVDQVVV